MADFCYKCVEETFEMPGDRNDLRGLCNPGYAVSAICEGCGAGWFDHEGKRVGAAELEQLTTTLRGRHNTAVAVTGE